MSEEGGIQDRTQAGGPPNSERSSHVLSDGDAAARAKQLAAAQQITHVGSWEWTIQTNVVVWSDELYRIYGLEPQSCHITFESFLGRLHPDDRTRVKGAVSKAVETQKPFGYPERIVRPDGSIRELDTLGEPSFEQDGRFRGLIGTCRDVTEERARDSASWLYANIVQNVQIGLVVWSLEDTSVGTSLRLRNFNPAAQQLLGIALTPAVGKTIAETFPSPLASELPSVLTEVVKTAELREIDQFRLVGTETVLAVKAFPLPGRSVGMAIEDITRRIRDERLKVGINQTLEMITAGAPLEETLTKLIRVIEAESSGMMGSILMFDAAKNVVRTAAAPSLPDAYNRLLDGFGVGPSAGSCGTAVFLRRPVFVSDILEDPLWADHRYVVSRFGLRASWSTPIFANDGRVLGTFALYYREPRSPNPAQRDLIEQATHVAGIAIERNQMEEQLHAMTARVEQAREEERTGIAREIHDQLGQSLTGLKMDVAWIGRRATGSADISRSDLQDRVQVMSELIDDTINQVRRISAELRPGVLDHLGLLAACQWQAQEFQKRTSTPCEVTSNLGEAQLGNELSTAVFRIFQEALTNVARHANAGRVNVSLDQDGERLVLLVEDDGKGISSEAAKSPMSLGLLGVKERARRLGGDVIVAPGKSRGTVVRVSVPVPRSAEAVR